VCWPNLLINFVKRDNFLMLKGFDKQQLIYYGFVAIMFLLVALIIAGPEVIFIRQMSEYLVHIMLCLFALGFMFLIVNKTRLMLISFAACSVLCVFLKNESNGDFIYPKYNNTDNITVSHINLSNVDHPLLLINEVKRNRPDVVSFQEFTPDWGGTLNSKLKDEYPYQYESMRIDLYGKAIYSKYPLVKIDTLNSDIAFDIGVRVNKNSHIYSIISPYLNPSLDKNSLNKAKLQMKNISKYVIQEAGRIIVLGDFNMVYWSEEIRNFREATQLNNSRKDVVPVSLKLPYDHVFYSKNLQCVNVKDFLINRKERVGLLSVFQQNIEVKETKLQ
jgi:endonuclease/exonuclease/phosphatase (EEP) superfamily protein YafD